MSVSEKYLLYFLTFMNVCVFKYSLYSQKKVYRWEKKKIKNPHPNDSFVLFRLLTSKAYAWSAEEKCGSIKMEAADYFMVCGCNGAVK